MEKRKKVQVWIKMNYLTTFFKPTPMQVFSWKGEIDTIMTPMDSIRYYKHFLRAAMMAMEPQTGHVKTWVGGYNYKHFQYDQVKAGTQTNWINFQTFSILYGN